MHNDTTLYAVIYRALLTIYPEQHRRDYGEEMQLLFTDTLTAQPDGWRRFTVFLRTMRDTLAWAPREYMLAAESSYAGMPHYAKASGMVSTVLIAPFFALYFYHHAVLFFRYHFHMFGRPEFHPASLYAITLPTLSLVTMLAAGLWWLYRNTQRPARTSGHLWAAFKHDGLVFLVTLSCLAVIAIA